MMKTKAIETKCPHCGEELRPGMEHDFNGTLCVVRASGVAASRRGEVVKAEADAVQAAGTSECAMNGWYDWSVRAAWSDKAREAALEARLSAHEEHDAAADEHFGKAENQHDYHWRAGDAHALTAQALRTGAGGDHFHAARAHKAAGAKAPDAESKALHQRFYKLHADKAAEVGRNSPMGGHHLMNANDNGGGDKVTAAWSDAVQAAGTSEGAKKGWEHRGHLLSQYKDNESSNYHSENAQLLAENFGHPEEAEIARQYVALHKRLGEATKSGIAFQGEMSGKYYKHILPPAKASSATVSDVVHCRASGSAAGAKLGESKAWAVGEPVEFMWMPAGVSTICAGFRGGSIELTVRCDEATAEAVQASLDEWRKERRYQEPFGCVEHREQEASVRVTAACGFKWNGDGVYIAAEPTTLGATNVNGRVHRSWSPSFTTDADYAKAKEENGVLVFPDGVRGSRSNPASITGVDFCVGTLTNKPAFHEMRPVKAKEAVQVEQKASAPKQADPLARIMARDEELDRIVDGLVPKEQPVKAKGPALEPQDPLGRIMAKEHAVEEAAKAILARHTPKPVTIEDVVARVTKTGDTRLTPDQILEKIYARSGGNR